MLSLRLEPLKVALATAWRQVKPRPDADTAARALVDALLEGASLGDALARTGPRLAEVAVSDAARTFDGGALALFIVDVRDSLTRQLARAGQLSRDASVRHALGSASRRVDDDTFVQHLINTLLTANGVYVESMAVKHIDEGRSAREVAALLKRSMCLLISRNDAARRLGERTSRLEFILSSPEIPVAGPSAPR